jgi:diphthamide synthase (EF-2-diphthine--ammonia ligase)
LNKVLLQYKETDIRDIAFGDIFLEDIKEYREALISGIGMECVFPIWKRNSASLAGHFIKSGFRAVVVCVDTEQLDAKFAGREFDERFLRDLPDGVDPCGENGEFHTLV